MGAVGAVGAVGWQEGTEDCISKMDVVHVVRSEMLP